MIILSGQATITVDAQEVSLGQYDAVYIPRDSSVKITTNSSADIAEFSAEVAKRYPLQVVHFLQVPAPAFGIQLVYNQTEYPELLTVVRDSDAVLMPSGYHPNVAVPGHPICFLWAMAAHREGEDRRFGVVNVQRRIRPGIFRT